MLTPPRIIRSFCLCWLLPTFALFLTGCGKAESDGYPVSGSVTHRGEPVPAGNIQFIPDSAKGNSGPAISADIADGKYNTADRDRGTVGGPQKVIVSGFDGNADLANELPLGKPLFLEYRTTADLPRDAKGVFDIDVE